VRIIVDRELCVGAGQCVWALPSVFDQDEEDGRVTFIGGDTLTPEQERRAEQAARLCPSGAIAVAVEEVAS
jgi:ferredoxin